MDLAVLTGRNHKEEADPFNWVIRAKIQSAMDEQYHRCKLVIDQHLKAYYGERQGSVFARAGITGRATVELFEAQATQLVASLAETVRPMSCNPRAFQMIAEMTMGFVNYLDLVVGRIGPRIDLEMRNFPRSDNLVQGTGDMWRESRGRILETLGRHREDFGLSAAEDFAEPAAMEETVHIPPVLEAEGEVPVPQFDLLAEVASVTELPRMAEEEEAAPLLEPEGELPVPEFELLAAAAAPDPAIAQEEGEDLVPILDLEVEYEAPAIEAMREPSPSLSQWHEMWADFAVQLCSGQIAPTSRLEIRHAMSDWFAAHGMDGLDDELDECARTFWKKFAPAEPIRSSLGLGGIGEDTASFDRLVWQADSPRSAGLAASANALPRKADVQCSVANAPLETLCAPAIESAPALEEPAPMTIRYQVSWTERPAPGTPAPFIDIDWE